MPTDVQRIARIKKFRFERGETDALVGEPPTEANEEYQAGYKEGLRLKKSTDYKLGVAHAKNNHPPMGADKDYLRGYSEGLKERNAYSQPCGCGQEGCRKW